METLIKAGGYFNVGLALFHLSFWRIFNWHDELARVSALNSAVMQVLNISLTLAFVIFAYISFMHAGELLTTPLGHSLLVLMALFWLARTIQQAIFFRLHALSIVFLLIFLSGFTLYALPALAVLRVAD